MTFDAKFVWGAAAASFQIEGAAEADGKGPSVWDDFCRQPGRVRFGHHGRQACDHYHLADQDVAMMAELGLQAYRLSIAWPRVFADGIGACNAKGLAFYDRLVDSLLNQGIQPWVTLFHWDYPLALYHRGGWLNPDAPRWFADYSAKVVDTLSDRVRHWMTLNEPQCFIGLGHQTGEHAPGLRLGLRDCLLAAHHSLLAHGLAVQVIRARSKQPCQIGAAPVGIIKFPDNPNDPADVAAARQATFAVRSRDLWNNSWWTDPMLLGHYPEDGLALFGADVPAMGADDLACIAQPLDFYGVNIYHGERVRAAADGGHEVVAPPAGRAATTMEWDVSPEALYWGPRLLHERYGLPIVVTENGMANTDWLHSDGAVHDPQRIDFMTRYLRQLKRAAADGVPVAGYFYWSIMDNFEWALGYDRRFGLVYVDYATGRRIPKDSALWYRELIRSQGRAL